MPRGAHSLEMNAPCELVFDTIHDYGRRLEWDAMLSRAELLDGATNAAVGVRSLCVGTWRGAFLGLETEYVRFVRGEVAAVKLTNRPPFFEHFAATIRHEPVGHGRSRTTYVFSFRARPRLLAWPLEPIMYVLLLSEVRRRLRALRRYIETPSRLRRK